MSHVQHVVQRQLLKCLVLSCNWGVIFRFDLFLSAWFALSLDVGSIAFKEE